MTVDPCYAIVCHIILKTISVILARETPIMFQLNETDFMVELSVGRRKWPFGRIWQVRSLRGSPAEGSILPRSDDDEQ